MTYTLDQNTSAGNRGSHYNKGADYIFYVNEQNRGIYRQPVNPATLITQQAPKKITSGSTHNINGLGAVDLKWTGTNLQGQNGAKVIKLTTTATSLDEISPDTIKNLGWGAVSGNNSISETGQTTAPGVFFAVQVLVTGYDPHYVKVRIFKEGSDTKMEWMAYSMSTRPWLMYTLSTDYPAPRDIIVSPYESDLYVSGGNAGSGYYVLQIQRTVAGSFPQYSDYPTPLHDSSVASNEPNAINNPQQLVVDGTTIYVIADGGLFMIDSLSNRQGCVVSGIANPIGLLLDAQGATKKAYISDTSGNIYVANITDFQLFDVDGNPSQPIAAPSPTASLALGGQSGFLTWADDTHTVFYATRVNDKKTVRVDLIANSVATEDNTGDSPWSIEVFDEHSLTVICDASIGDAERGIPIPLTNVPLLMGIGLIPFDYIKNSAGNPAVPSTDDGTVTTPVGYFFGGNANLPFAGSLSLMINHKEAWNSNVRYYKITMSNDTTGITRTITNSFGDMKWNATANPPRFELVSTGAQNGFFPIRNIADLWYNPYLAAIISTTNADNDFNRLKIDFYDANKQPIANGSFTRLIYIDNSVPTGKLYDIRRGTDIQAPGPNDYASADACGLLAYTTKDDLVAVDLNAYHTKAGGTYSVAFKRGATTLFSVSGAVGTDPVLLTITERLPGQPLRVGHLTGDCDIANVSISLSVPSRAINGYSWVNLSASSGKAFTLAPAGSATHTTWTPP